MYISEVVGLSDIRVIDLIDKEAGEWDREFMYSLFMFKDAEIIMVIFLCILWPEDFRVWYYENKGEFSVK